MLSVDPFDMITARFQSPINRVRHFYKVYLKLGMLSGREFQSPINRVRHFYLCPPRVRLLRGQSVSIPYKSGQAFLRHTECKVKAVLIAFQSPINRVRHFYGTN